MERTKIEYIKIFVRFFYTYGGICVKRNKTKELIASTKEAVVNMGRDLNMV
jgi:hypothetical protein